MLIVVHAGKLFDEGGARDYRRQGLQPIARYSRPRFVLSDEEMGAFLGRPEFLLAGVVRSSRGVQVLARTVGTAKQDRAAFCARDFTKAAVSDWVATNQALSWDGGSELRCPWFTVIG